MVCDDSVFGGYCPCESASVRVGTKGVEGAIECSEYVDWLILDIQCGVPYELVKGLIRVVFVSWSCDYLFPRLIDVKTVVSLYLWTLGVDDAGKARFYKCMCILEPFDVCWNGVVVYYSLSDWVKRCIFVSIVVLLIN